MGVRQVLEYRLARLPQESVDLLRVASVVGAPDVGRLASVTGLAEAEVAALLDEPAAAGVVVAGAFAHELMRETLYLGMSPDRRASLHRQVAEHLQAEGPAELARHWFLASGADARPRAAQLAVVAGDLAAAGLAYEQAVGHYRMALELGVGDLSVRRRLGEAQVMAGQIGAGRDILRTVAGKARDAGAAEELARAVLAMGGGVGGFEVDLFDVGQTPLLEDALRLLPDPRQRAPRRGSRPPVDRRDWHSVGRRPRRSRERGGCDGPTGRRHGGRGGRAGGLLRCAVGAGLR